MFLFHTLEDTHALGGCVDIAAQAAVFFFPLFQALAFCTSVVPQGKGLLFKSSGLFLPVFLLCPGFLMPRFGLFQGFLLFFPLLQGLLAGGVILFQPAAQVFAVPAQHESVTAALGIGIDPFLQGLGRRFSLGFGLAEQGLGQGQGLSGRFQFSCFLRFLRLQGLFLFLPGVLALLQLFCINSCLGFVLGEFGLPLTAGFAAVDEAVQFIVDGHGLFIEMAQFFVIGSHGVQ